MKKDVLIYFDLITSLKTTQEVANFISEIDALKLMFFKSEAMSMEKALASISRNYAQKISQVFSKCSLDANDRNNISVFLDTLKELVKKLKTIKLVLAFDPSNKTLEKIHNFVKETIGIGYVLDIETSEEILGGAIVIFDGKYNDFTLKKDLGDTFIAKKDQIISIVG